MLLVLGGLSLLGAASTDLYLPGLPEMTRDFGVPASVAQLTIATYLVGLGLGQVVAGPLSDVFGRKRPMLAAIVVYVLVSLLCAAAPTMAALIAGRFLQGAAAAAGSVISRAVVRDLYAGAAGARLLSRLVFVYGAAPVAAPLLGGQILLFTSWRGLFVGLAVLGLLLLAATALALPETLPAARRHGRGVRRMLASYRLLVADRGFLGYSLALGLATGSIVGYVAGSAFVLQEIYGVSVQAYGLFIGVNAAAMIAASQLNAHLVSRVDPHRLLVLAGFAVVATGAALLVFVIAGLGLWSLAPCFLVLMCCWGFIPPNAVALGMARHRDVAGSASAVMGAFQYGVAALAAPLVGVAGKDTAIPMVLVILIPGALSVAAVRILTPTRRDPA
jgi:DHA1 family bicyclomycin/chloramphenicol resistance-like MFS transporter